MSSEVKWHVLPENSASFNEAIGSVNMYPKDISDLLQSYLHDLVHERAMFCGVEKKIDDMIERRVEVAVKNALDRVSAGVSVAVEQCVRERVRTMVNAMPIDISIKVG